MAEQQELRSSKNSGLFGKLKNHKKGKMRYKRTLLDDEESLVCDDKHEASNNETVNIQTNYKTEAVFAARCEEPVKEGSTLETGTQKSRVIQRDSVDASYHDAVQLTDINSSESEVTPESACIIRVNAIIENNTDNANEKPEEGKKVGFLVTANELCKSETSLLQNEKPTITSHFDNLSVSHAETSAVTVAVCEVPANPGGEYETEDGNAGKLRTQGHAVEADRPHVEHTSRFSATANSNILGKESPRKKKKAKKMTKSTKKNKMNLEATSDEEISYHAHSSYDIDQETIEILVLDPEAKKEKQKKRRKKAKRIVATAGLTMWKGIRTGWKLMWNGLSMYTLPLGSLDVTTNITKFWSAHNNSSSQRA